MQLNHFHIATSIVLGFILVAVAIFFKLSSPTTAVIADSNANNASVKQYNLSPEQIRRTENRNVYGNPKAEITVVEFSDFECPFCARLHPTLKRIVDESNGAIAWEFRHLPLPMHQNAHIAAVASECVAKHLDNTTFWDYTNILFDNVGENSPDFLRDSALKIGLSPDKFEACLTNEEIERNITQDMNTARELGGSGTPFSVILKGDEIIPMIGALPYEEWQRKLRI